MYALSKNLRFHTNNSSRTRRGISNQLKKKSSFSSSSSSSLDQHSNHNDSGMGGTNESRTETTTTTTAATAATAAAVVSSNTKDALHLDDITQLIAEEHGLSNAKSRRIVRGVFDWIIENVANHDKDVKITGFGKFSNVQVQAKQIRNIQTGELMTIPKRQRVKFTPFSSFKSAMKEEKT